jgi:hypothetical protein
MTHSLSSSSNGRHFEGRGIILEVITVFLFVAIVMFAMFVFVQQQLL